MRSRYSVRSISAALQRNAQVPSFSILDEHATVELRKQCARGNGGLRCFRNCARVSEHVSSQLTAEEAGRKASQVATERRKNEHRIQRILRAVDHVEIEGEDIPNNDSNMATLLSHAGIPIDLGSGREKENLPMSPPLHTATTYTRPADGIYKNGDSIYARMDNPTRVLLEQTVFELECSGLPSVDESMPKSTFCFSSGMQAVTAILLAHNSSNTTVLIPTDVYHGVRTVLSDVFARHGVKVKELKMAGELGIQKIKHCLSDIALENSQVENEDEKNSSSHSVIIWMETPSNPKCEVVDIQGVCEMAKFFEEEYKDDIQLTTVVDGTMASPVLTRPLEFGADVSFHSGTKYLGGHSDALIGIVTTSPETTNGLELAESLRTVQIAGGGVASPWDSWLTLRGMRTLHLRVEQQCRTAMKLAEYLFEKQQSSSDSRVAVKAVHYPGLPTHPQHDIAKRQMKLAHHTSSHRSFPSHGFGGVFSFELSDEVEATAFAGALTIIHRATSLGGTETLIEHRASIEPPESVVSPQGLLRVSVGLEDLDDLIRDFEEAFAIVDEVIR